MSKIEKKLTELGCVLPPIAKPVAAYIPAIQTGNLVMTSGQLPMKEGKLVAEGLLGKDVEIDVAAAAAQLATLNALAAIKGVIGDLDRIKQVVKVVVFVASTPDFTAQPKVANGASEFLQKVFGEAGIHTRSAVGCPSLPLNTPVEVEVMVEVK
jgi:enamine deaminase RidA (YjgF/YER057c/UK114 family)